MIAKQNFGRTGHQSTRIIFGGAALWERDPVAANQMLKVLLEHGINHIDTAASYKDSELNIGPWMPEHRQKFFLATKSEKRTRQEAWEELQRSLKRLQTDVIDLWQMHYLVDPTEWETAMGPGGALEAFVEAREKGLVRFLGVTGHDVAIPAMHLRSLERFDFDSVLLPFNYAMMQNSQYAADVNELLAVCQERNVAVQTIKGICRRPWGDRPKTNSTWYQPYTEQADIDRAVQWVLGQPNVFLNTASDTTLFPKILHAASHMQSRPSEAEMARFAADTGMEPLFT